jgi:hypothetical protein
MSSGVAAGFHVTFSPPTQNSARPLLGRSARAITIER